LIPHLSERGLIVAPLGRDSEVASRVLSENGVISATGSLKYQYVRTRTDLSSTQITSFVVSGQTATIAGDGTVNGVAGYHFVATVTGAASDAFGITITKPDGTQLYQYAGQTVTGGDLVVTVK